ncbi:MAG: hypothetical protein JWQ54_1139 [Mucilaginibacter sp.]|nr:hypothetical protein [Mucilaginibacter sp.]
MNTNSIIKAWFTDQETTSLINEIITKIQLCNIDIGVTDDQMLLMFLLNKTVTT